jgi:hypothetical protein
MDIEELTLGQAAKASLTLKVCLDAMADIHFGSLADIEAHSPDVRFTPKSRHSLT